MGRKVGDYEWRQVSMWDSVPGKCIEKYVEVGGKNICHFYLQRICEICSDSSWKMEVVIDLSVVPNDVLNWRNDDYSLKE